LHDFKLEDTVLLLDMSRSMLRKDFKPNRLQVALQTAKNFIQTKFSIDPKDRISIISFGETTKKLSPFSFDEQTLIDSLKKVHISGKGLVQAAIAFSLQILVEEMRKIGGKIQRIFIISDDKLKSDENKLQKMIKIAKGLGVFIDACQLGKTQDYRQSTLKKIAQITGGEYGYFTNTKALVNAGKAFASKKNIEETTDYFNPNKKNEIPPLISEVALALRRPTVMEIRLMMRDGGRGQDKCQICHSIKAPLTSADFYSEGRYCPNCDRAMHLSCAGQWAKRSEYSKKVFRCPFCFFLLELPKYALKIVEDKKLKELKDKTQKIQIIEESQINTTEMVRIPDEDVEQIHASCAYCHNIFLGDYSVFLCKRCSNYYHQPCLEKMYKEIKACRFCGAKITFD